MEDTILTTKINSNLGERVRRKNRNRIEIMASMLEIAGQGVKKTQLMYKGNLSFGLLHKYLESLMISALIEQQQEKNQFIYKTTQKGIQFLKHYFKLQKHAAEYEFMKNELEKFFKIDHEFRP